MLNRVIIDKFLDSASCAKLLRFCLDNEASFQAATVLGDQAWRSARILHHFEPWQSEFRNRVGLHTPSVAMLLGIPAFDIGAIEVQLVAHNDGAYFKAHVDNSNDEVASRMVSYTYYFHREPRPFEGGDLVLDNERYPVVNNRIIFWRPSSLHAVEPVRVPSQAWRDCRFCISGWSRKA